MSYRHFSIEEREMIARGLSEGKSRSKIAKELGRHHSSVGDEIRRNSIDGTYWPSKAQALADQRKRDSKHLLEDDRQPHCRACQKRVGSELVTGANCGKDEAGLSERRRNADLSCHHLRMDSA